MKQTEQIMLAFYTGVMPQTLSSIRSKITKEG